MMEEKRSTLLLGKYIWQYRYTACMFAAYMGIAAAVFSLYELEVEAVWYTGGLCGILTAVVLAVHYRNYRNGYLKRQVMFKNIRILNEPFPTAGTLAEADYQQMVAVLRQICEADLTQWRNERQEQMDYYTTWVHQIKTPIAVMRMILQDEDTKEHRELLAELFRIEQYVEMVLGYLRLGSTSSDFVFKAYRLDEIIRQAIHKYASQFVRKRIRLVYEPTEVTVLTDEKWLLFMIEQVLSNAVKYTREGAVHITVTKEKVLQIADTGIGIAPEDLPRIFEKGFTGYNGRADKKSTGLGLYLCRMAAKRLSHRIWAESEVSRGTVISIDLHTDPQEFVE